MPRTALIAEFFLLFIGLPLAYRFSPLRIPVLPLPWAVTLYAWIQLMRDPHFERQRLWNFDPIHGALIEVLLIFLLSALLIWMGVRLWAPQLQWSFVKQHPAFWAVVMIAYPVLSVYPQGMVYRAFFFERYAPLFPGKWTMILASALAFALMHIIFRNWLAVVLTFAGGVLFAWRYAATGSLAVSSFEHSLYGCWLFTVGLGQYFYHGTIATAGSAIRR